MMNKSGIVVFFIAALMISLSIGGMRASVAAASAAEDAPQVTLEVVPSTIELQSQGSETVLVTARNKGALALSAATLDGLPGRGIQIADLDRQPREIAPDEAAVWTVRVARVPGARISGGVTFRMSYTWKASATAQTPTLGEAFATLQVTDGLTVAVSKWVETKVVLSSGQVADFRPAEGYLMLTNVSGGRLTVQAISFENPSFLKITPAYALPLDLEPQETRAFPFSVEALGGVRPGKHLLLINLEIQPGSGGDPPLRIATTQEIDTGVLGESQLLTLLGIPSFLFLPGFLMVLAFGLLWRNAAPQKEFPIKTASPEFFFAAITLSLVMMLVYPALFGQNYLDSYNLQNVLEVWFRSLLLALLLYLASIGLYYGLHAYAAYQKAKEIRLRVLDGKESQTVMLRKLGRQGLGVKLERKCVRYKGMEQNAYLFEPLTEDQKMVWVGPEIGVQWQSIEPALKAEIDRQMEADGNPELLAGLLERGIKEGRLAVMWNKIGQVDQPVRLKIEDFISSSPPGIVVVELTA